MIATAITGFSLLIKTLGNSKETIDEINQECANRGLPPAFTITSIGDGFIQGNTDYCFRGFGMTFASIIPPRVELTFWVHYRIDSPDHVELGRFSCPLQTIDGSINDLLGNTAGIPLDAIRLGERVFDETEAIRLEVPQIPIEEVARIRLDESEVEAAVNDLNNELKSDPEKYCLRATHNTVLKLSDVPSPELSNDEKADFLAGNELPLMSFQNMGTHVKVTLANTLVKGRKTWVAYKDHVEIMGVDGRRILGRYKLGDRLPKEVNLSVPWYSQRDNKYHPKTTCNVTCVAMVLAYFGIRPKAEQGQLEDQLYLEVTEQGRNHADRTYHSELDALIKSYSIQNKFDTEVSWEAIKVHLANGYPVIMSSKLTADGHIVVLRGYDETGFWVNDPWGEWFASGYRKVSGENLHYSYKLCRRCSRGNGDVTWAHLPSDPNHYYAPSLIILGEEQTSSKDDAGGLNMPEFTAAELSKKTAQAIVNVFETSNPRGDYGSVICDPHDLGGLTYGRSQTTIDSGNLYLLIKDYCEAEGAEFADKLRPYLEPLANKARSLECQSGSHELRHLKAILRNAGADPVMQSVQDAFFDRAYWAPAFNAARELSIQTPLGQAVVYDSFIHGSWARMRDRTHAKHGRIDRIGEKAWIKAYVDTRRHWLANHSNRLLPRTVYRMDAFKQLIRENNWELKPPLSVRGCRIDRSVLSVAGSSRAELSGFRILKLASPYLSGEDVEQVQTALRDHGYFPATEVIDGIYGPNTASKVEAFQRDSNSLKVDGIVGLQTWNALGLETPN